MTSPRSLTTLPERRSSGCAPGVMPATRTQRPQRPLSLFINVLCALRALCGHPWWALVRRGGSATAYDNAWPFSSVPAVVEDDAAVDDDGRDADRILKRIGKGGAIDDSCRVEDHEVRRQPVLDEPAIRDVQLPGGQAAHLVDGLFQRNHFFLANVLAEHARERPEVTRVRDAVAQRSAGRQRRAVRSDRHPRLLYRQLQIVFVDDEPDTADAAAVGDEDFEDEVVRIFPGGLRRIVDAHAFVFLVRRLANRRQLNVVPGAGGDETVLPGGVRVVHLLADLRARLRIFEPLGQLGAAAFVRPRWHGL